MTKIIKDIIENNIDARYVEIRRINELLTDDKEIILQIIDNIETNKLYNSKIHGLNHSIKVMIFAYVIAKLENIDKVDKRIIIDAALYHDIGRISDNEDDTHGLSSAYLINSTKAIKHNIYKDNPDNLNILKAIIDGHSQSDKKIDLQAEFYDVVDIERYKKLYRILKDADALDRKRFSKGYKCSLNPEFLRIETSKELIKFSEEINEILKIELSKIVPDIKKDGTEKDCIHSIGFDFFKLNTILNYGILSKSKIKELNLEIPRNFEGGNLDNWISVIDGSLIQENYTGMKEFVKNGISFYCTADYLEKGLGEGFRTKAIESGMPYNQGLHKDEKYVYKEIPSSNILAIIIPENYKDIDISKLNYIYNSLSMDVLKDRINFYYKKMSEHISINYSEIVPFLNEYELILNKYHNLEQEEKELFKIELPSILEEPKNKINNVIQKWFKNFYAYKLSKNVNEKITVTDVVCEELKSTDFNYNFVNTNNELLIFITNNTREEQKQKLRK